MTDLKKSYEVREDKTMKLRQQADNLDGVVRGRVRVNTSAVVLARYQRLMQLAVPKLQQRRDDVGVRNRVIVGRRDPVITLGFQR